MFTMKRIIALILALIMVLSFAACSNDEEAHDHDHDHDHDHTEEPSVSESEEQPEEEPEKDVLAKRGTVADYIYSNDAFGLGFEADTDWLYYSDEEIAATMGIAAEKMLSPEAADLIQEATIIYDMYCVNLTTGSSVNINHENIGALYGSIVDDEYYLEISKTQLEAQAAGLDFTRNEVGTAVVAGEEVPCLYVEINFSGMKVYETILAKKSGNWISVITVSGMSEEDVLDTLTRVSL